MGLGTAGHTQTQPHLREMSQSKGAKDSDPLPATKHCYSFKRTLQTCSKFGITICFPDKCSSLFCFPLESARVLIWDLETGVCSELLKSFPYAFPIIEKVLTLFQFKTEQVLCDHQINKTRLFSTQTASGIKALNIMNGIILFIFHFIKHLKLTFLRRSTIKKKKR